MTLTDPAGEPPTLPDQTSDDTDEGWEPTGQRITGDGELTDDERRLLADRPPHWDR